VKTQEKVKSKQGDLDKAKEEELHRPVEPARVLDIYLWYHAKFLLAR